MLLVFGTHDCSLQHPHKYCNHILFPIKVYAYAVLVCGVRQGILAFITLKSHQIGSEVLN